MNTTKSERRFDWLCAGAAVVVGTFAGAVDFHNNEPQAAAAALLALGAVLGFIRPRGAWRWGLIAALGIPAVHVIGCAAGFKPVDTFHPNIFASLIALIPAMMGVYGGAFARRIFIRQNSG